MITEDYVSFETAKLLKEKGFQAKCTACYHSGPSHTFKLVSGRINYCNPRFSKYKMIPPYNAPTLQMAMKWLREEKKLYVNVWAEPKDFENNDFSTIYRMHVYNGTSNNGTREFSKYEDACETGIRYCLENLI